MTFTEADMLAAVDRSPQAAHRHDRAAWIDLFAPDARIEDPVGSRPHVGRAEIARFYDTFIGVRTIAFHRDVDIVVGTTVVRDLVIEVAHSAGRSRALGAPPLSIPAYLRYDLQEHQGELRIAALLAHWELPAMVRQFVRGGVAAVPAGLQLSGALLANQGPAGVAGFLLGFRGIGAAGRAEFGRFLADAAVGDEVAVRRRLTKGARITRGDAEPLGAANLMARLVGTRSRKVIAAGHTLVAGIERPDGRDVLFADVDPTPLTINRVRYFTTAI